MKKKAANIILAMVTAAFVLTGCSGGQNSTENEMTLSQEEMTEETAAGEEETDGGENGASDREIEEKVEKGKTEPGDETEALLAYADSFSMCNLGNTQLTYETIEGDGYSYFQTQGLMGLAEDKEGCLYKEILDLDADGWQELLTIDLSKGSEAYGISASVFEYKDGKISKAATKELLSYAIGMGCDGGNIRFMMKDEKYLCMDSWQHTFVSADGVCIDLAACYYDGAGFVEMVQYGLAGSDFSDSGKEATELLDQLYTMGFDKSAAAICDRDVFHLYAADEGVRPLFKISIQNSLVTGETEWEETPYATVLQIESAPVNEEFVLPDSNSRILEASGLSGMTKDQLRIARNEIYARYGWLFEDQELQSYFNTTAWYVPAENVDDSILSDVERANKDVIVEAEKTAPEKAEDVNISTMNIEGGTPLTVSELADMSGELKKMDAYGFLYSLYDDVRDVDLNNVFYSGAGISQTQLTDSMAEAYLKETGQTEFFTDSFALKKSDIDALLQKRTGYGLSDMRKPLEWVYLDKEQVYCVEVGDTNYMEVSVIEGMKTEDGMYYIEYENPALAYQSDNTMCMVTLKKQGDTYRFVSNVKLED